MRVMLVGLPEQTAQSCAEQLEAEGVDALICPNVSFAIVERVRFEPDGVLAAYQEAAAANLMRHFGAWNGATRRPWVLIWSAAPLPWEGDEFARLDLDDWLEGPADAAALVRRLRQGLNKASRRTPPAGEAYCNNIAAAEAIRAAAIAAGTTPPAASASPLRIAATAAAAKSDAAFEYAGACAPPPAFPPMLAAAGVGKRCNSLDRLAQWAVQLFASSQHDVRSLLEGVVNILAVNHLVVGGLDREPEDATPIYLGPVPDWRRAAFPMEWPQLRKRMLGVVDEQGGRPFLWNIDSPREFPPSLYGVAGPPTGGLWISSFRVAGGRRGVFAAFRSDGGLPWTDEEAKFLEFFTAVFAHIADGAHPGLTAPLESRIRDRTLRLTQANELLRREITERRRIQSALSESIERFELAARGSNDGLWDARILTNRDTWRSGQIDIWYSARFKQVLGYEDWEFENTLENWAVRLHPDDRERVLTALDDHLYRKAPYDVEYRILNKNGQYGWCQARGQALWDENGLPVRMAGSLRDVTERKLAAQALEESEERYRKLVELSPDAILVLSDARLVYINPTGARMLGFESDAVDPCLDLTRFVSEETLDRLTRPQSSVSGPHSREVHEDHLTRTDGEPLSIEWVAAPIHYVGRPASMAVCRDVTERKKSEAALRQEREVLRQLLNAHERERQLVSYEIHDGLGQYLVGAVMRMEALGEQLPPVPHSCRDQWELAMHLVKTSLREARRLISGLRPPILDEYGIVSAIEYLIQEPKGDGSPNIVFESDVHFDRLPPILETTIFRIVQEAVSNAKRHGKARNIVIHLSDDEGRISLRIRDDGVGFTPDRAHGKGYGLQGMRERARLLGGKAVVRSRPEGGAVVEVDLPLVDPQPEIAAAGVRVAGP